MKNSNSKYPNQTTANSVKSEHQNPSRRRDNMTRLKINDAVQEWEKTIPGQAQETIARLVAEKFREQGGRGITVSKQNLFRYLRNEGGSDRYNRYVMQLLPAIIAVIPVRLARAQGFDAGKTEEELVASAIKECSEAHHAMLMNVPEIRLMKEVIEGVVALIEMLPGEKSAPLLASLAETAPQYFLNEF